MPSAESCLISFPRNLFSVNFRIDLKKRITISPHRDEIRVRILFLCFIWQLTLDKKRRHLCVKFQKIKLFEGKSMLHTLVSMIFCPLEYKKMDARKIL